MVENVEGTMDSEVIAIIRIVFPSLTNWNAVVQVHKKFLLT